MSGRVSLGRVLERSVEVILEHQATTGAYIAAPVPTVYRYAWFRDGAFIADAASRAGARGSAEAFFDWCARVVEARRPEIERLVERGEAGEPVDRDEHVHCRYTVDGDEVGLPWSNFQLDGLGTCLWALAEHEARGGTVRNRESWALVARYLATFATEPCFDWWEETWGVHLATLASLHGGLAAAGRLGLHDDGEALERVRARALEGVRGGRFCARIGEDGVDASLLACATPFRLVAPDDPVMAATVEALEEEIVHGGGVHRYPGDSYYGGGEWILLAALLGWWQAEAGLRDEAHAQLDWIVAHAHEGGDLPEQVQDHLLVPAGFERWNREFGPPPVPLLWSHAMTLTLADALGLEAGTMSG